MKLNDIYTNLPENLDLSSKNKKKAYNKDKLSKINLEGLSKKRKKTPNLAWNKFIKISKKNNLKSQDILKKWYLSNEINLYKKILRSKFLFSFSKQEQITSYIKLKYMSFKEKNSLFKYSAIAIFLFMFLILDVTYTKYLTKSWFENISSIKNITDFKELDNKISDASFDFAFANILFKPFLIFPGQKIKDTNNIIKTGKNTSILLGNSFDIINNIKKYIEWKNINEIAFSNLILNQKDNFKKIEKNTKALLITAKEIKLDGDFKNKRILEANIEKIKLVKNYITTINKNFDTFLNIFWHKKRKKYLIVFQNNDEIRPTWWFIWSVWFIDIFRWKLENFEKKDIYALEWDVKKNYNEKVIPVTWINLLAKRLWLRDANSYIDISKSSKAINYFLKKWWYNIDWIIYINQKTILDILKDVWEINFPKYDIQINHKNFSEIISLLVEAKVSKKATLDTPKQVLFDFSNILTNKILKEKKYSQIWKTILNNIISRDIVFYSFNKKESIFLDKLELNWKFDYINQTDFNYPFFLSVWWNKSDRFIQRNYEKTIEIYSNSENNLCTLNTEIKLNLKNTFSKTNEDRIILEMKKFNIKQNRDLLNIAGKWLNQNYTKIIIPWKAKINEKKLNDNWYILLDHQIYKTVEKLLKTAPWKESNFHFNYQIDNVDCVDQNYKIYKQAGIYNYNVKLDYINYQNNYKEKLNLSWLSKDFYYNTEKLIENNLIKK